jgi:hypothetical protein
MAKDKTTARNGTPQLLTNAGAETKSPFLKKGKIILSKTWMKRSHANQKIIEHKFIPVALIWFYSMIAGFLKHRENEVARSGLVLQDGFFWLISFLPCYDC